MKCGWSMVALHITPQSSLQLQWHPPTPLLTHQSNPKYPLSNVAAEIPDPGEEAEVVEVVDPHPTRIILKINKPNQTTTLKNLTKRGPKLIQMFPTMRALVTGKKAELRLTAPIHLSATG